MNDLFDIPETLSPRLAWMRKHGILTHKSDVDPPWIAIRPIDGHTGTIGEIMAEWCVLYDEQNAIGYGETENDALADLARKLNLKLWNQ